MIRSRLIAIAAFSAFASTATIAQTGIPTGSAPAAPAERMQKATGQAKAHGEKQVAGAKTAAGNAHGEKAAAPGTPKTADAKVPAAARTGDTKPAQPKMN